MIIASILLLCVSIFLDLAESSPVISDDEYLG